MKRGFKLFTCLAIIAFADMVHAKLSGSETGYGSSEPQACNMAKNNASNEMERERFAETRIGPPVKKVHGTLGDCSCSEKSKDYWWCEVTWSLDIER